MKCFNFELSLKFIWCHARRLLWTANSSYHGRVWPAKLSHAICYLNSLWHPVLWVSGLDNFITIQTIRWSLPFVILNKCRALRHPSFSSFQMFQVFICQITSSHIVLWYMKKQSPGGVLKNFAKFTGKNLCRIFFFNKVAD